jgi:hypothetical protein
VDVEAAMGSAVLGRMDTEIPLSAEESRQLGINLHFVTHIFPQQAQSKAVDLLKNILPKKAHPTADEQKLLRRYNTPKGGISSYFGSAEEVNVKSMTFIELSKIVAYGDVAYGKGVRCPRDGQPDCSIVDAVYPRGCSQKATLFLSWVWGYTLATALSAVNNYSDNHNIKGSECFIWWCFFQNNQFRMLGDSGQKQTFATLCSVFGTQLQEVGQMVCMLDHIEESRYSKRLWCLFEVYVAATSGIPMDVMLPVESTDEVDHLMLNGGLRTLKAAIEVDAEKATASFPEDQEGIRSLIEDMEGGYDTLNMIVRRSLGNSMMLEISKAIGISSPPRTPASMASRSFKTKSMKSMIAIDC